jgi:hypothetical protein
VLASHLVAELEEQKVGRDENVGRCTETFFVRHTDLLRLTMILQTA